MQKPLTKPSTEPLLQYVRRLVTHALRAEGYATPNVSVGCDLLLFCDYWTGLVSVHGQASRGGTFYDLDGWGEVDKATGKPRWQNARVGIRLHSDSCEPAHYRLDVAYLELIDRSASR